jgi:hypothetical protein
MFDDSGVGNLFIVPKRKIPFLDKGRCNGSVNLFTIIVSI